MAEEAAKNERSFFAAFLRCGKRFGSTIDTFILRTYDAAWWLFDAFDACGSTDPDVLKEAICQRGYQGFDGIGGAFVLDETRNVERTIFFMKWNGDLNDPKFEEIKD